MSNDHPLVSVVIPTYNAAAFVRETIDSALAQDYKPIEIIVGDDASTDGTQEVLRSYGDRIQTILHRKNIGNGKLRNELIAAARGTFIAPLDHDDLWLPGKLSRQVELMQANEKAALCHTATELFDGESGPGPIDPAAQAAINGACFPTLFRRNGVVISSALVRRDMLPSPAFWENLAGVRDYGLWLRLLVRNEAIFLPEVLTKYRRHAGQITAHGSKHLQINAGLARLRVLEEFRWCLDRKLHDELHLWALEELSTCTYSLYWNGKCRDARRGFIALQQNGRHVPWRHRLRAAVKSMWSRG